MAARRRTMVVALLLSVSAPACGNDGSRTPPPDVLLVSIDTLRADRLGAYGTERGITPHLDRLAAEGALFETVIAPTSWTLPSHATLFTGLGIGVHGVEETFDRLDEARLTLAEALRRQGYRTQAFVSSPFLHREYGLARGFDGYANFGAGSRMEQLPPAPLEHIASHQDETAEEVVDHAVAWVEEHGPGGDPFYLFVHLWDPHYDYDPPEELARRFDPDYEGDLDVDAYTFNEAIHPGMPERDLQHVRALYDAEVSWTDAQLGRLLDALRRLGLLDGTVVSVVSDHGEEFFEHGRKGHGKALFEESVRVPWLVRYPPAVVAGRRVGGVVSLADVAPTLLDLAGLAPLPEATGRSVAELLGPDPPDAEPERPVFLSVRRQVGLRGPGWKVLVDRESGEAFHYDLEADPEEARPRPAERSAAERLERLRARLERDRSHRQTLEWRSRDAGRAELDEATRERLRELGYLEDDG